MPSDSKKPNVAVLNIDTQKIVYIPISHKTVIDKKSVIHGLTVRMPIISEKDYQEIASLIDIPAYHDSNNKDYFNYRCIVYTAGTDKNFFSDQAYPEIYNYLKSQGFTTKAMLEQIPKILEVFTELPQKPVTPSIECSCYTIDDQQLYLAFNAVIKPNPMRFDTYRR